MKLKSFRKTLGGNTMTNFEKLKELQEYEVAQIIDAIPYHVMEVQQATGADENLDAVDSQEDTIEIITSWLKDSYDEEKGFKLYLKGSVFYLTSENLEHFSYLEDTHNDYSDYFSSDSD